MSLKILKIWETMGKKVTNYSSNFPFFPYKKQQIEEKSPQSYIIL